MAFLLMLALLMAPATVVAVSPAAGVGGTAATSPVPLPTPSAPAATPPVWVPPQPVVIETPLAVTEGARLGSQQQVVEAPGYFASKTTLGFYYPGRCVIERVGAAACRWGVAAAEFRRR
jgi:hypothetical protein